MELYQLRAFVAVAESSHVTRAAERLHVSQPAVSAQIKALEEELGVRLFERTPAGMAPTSAGRRLLEHAHKVLGAVEDMRQLARFLTGEISGRLRIGTLSEPKFVRLGELLSRTVERYPLIELELHSEISGVALESVRDGVFDASFYLGELLYPAVAGMPLREVAFCIAAPAAWADQVRSADWSQIAAMPWVLMPPLSAHGRLALSLFRGHGVEPPTQVVVADRESAVTNLVVSGVGLSLMREDLALEKQQAGEVYIWEKARLNTTLWFIYLSEREHDPLIEAILDVLNETWKSGPAHPEPRPRARGRRKPTAAPSA